jgi:hypothetical protein
MVNKMVKKIYDKTTKMAEKFEKVMVDGWK